MNDKLREMAEAAYADWFHQDSPKRMIDLMIAVAEKHAEAQLQSRAMRVVEALGPGNPVTNAEALRAENARLAAEVNDLKINMNTWRFQNESLREQLDEARKDIECFKAQTAHDMDTIALVTKQLAERDAEIERLRPGAEAASNLRRKLIHADYTMREVAAELRAWPFPPDSDPKRLAARLEDAAGDGKAQPRECTNKECVRPELHDGACRVLQPKPQPQKPDEPEQCNATCLDDPPFRCSKTWPHDGKHRDESSDCEWEDDYYAGAKPHTPEANGEQKQPSDRVLVYSGTTPPQFNGEPVTKVIIRLEQERGAARAEVEKLREQLDEIRKLLT